MVMNISCNFEKSTYNTLASRGVTRKSLHTAAAAVAVAYSSVIHSIHRMLSSRYNEQAPFTMTLSSPWIHWPGPEVWHAPLVSLQRLPWHTGTGPG